MGFSSTDPLLNIELPLLRRRHGEIYWIELEAPVGGVTGLVVRALNRQEFLQIESDIESGLDVAEAALEQCIVYPSLDWAEPDNNPLYLLPFHAFDQLAEQVVALSGFNSPERFQELISEGRDHVSTLYGFMDTVIMKNLSGYTHKELGQLSLVELSRVYATAETALEEPFDFRLFLDPEYAEKVANKARKRQQKQQGSMPGRFTQNIPPPPQGWESSHPN